MTTSTQAAKDARDTAFEAAVTAAGQALKAGLATAGADKTARRAAWARYGDAQQAAGDAYRAARAAAQPDRWIGFRTLDAARHLYAVRICTGTVITIGTVQRHGSLPSCRTWSGKDDRTGQQTPPRDTRAQAAADVLAAWQQAGDPS